MPDDKKELAFEIDQNVNIKVNRTNGTVTGQWRERGTDWRYRVRYTTTAGAVCDDWFDADQITPGHVELIDD